VVLFIFSDKGNAFLAPYIQSRLEKATGMPVTIEQFTLRSGRVALVARLNRQLQLRVASNYNLVKRSFSGVYVLAAKHFTYETVLCMLRLRIRCMLKKGSRKILR